MLHQALILSSNREYAQAMRHALQRLGDEHTRIYVETDALRAMQLVPQEYELILLDLVLEATDGLQLLQMVKVQAPMSKFIIVADSADETSRALAYQSGADLFLQRPESEADFEKAVEMIEKLAGAQEDEPENSENEPPVVRISDIVQMRCLSGDSVSLMVESRQKHGDIFIFRGEVYHAQFPGKGGEAAFREMLMWDEGLVRIKVVKLAHMPPRTIEIPYRELLEPPANPGDGVGEMEQTGELYVVSGADSPETAALSVVKEAPPRSDIATGFMPDPRMIIGVDAKLPQVNSHWKISLSGELLEGSQVAEPDRCAFITTFMYRKMADVAVALEVDYFNNMTLYGTHLQQVLVADNMGVRHGVFDTVWTPEDARVQYVKWCCEQSF